MKMEVNVGPLGAADPSTVASTSHQGIITTRECPRAREDLDPEAHQDAGEDPTRKGKMANRKAVTAVRRTQTPSSLQTEILRRKTRVDLAPLPLKSPIRHQVIVRSVQTTLMHRHHSL